MDVFDAIRSRRSVRKFTGEPVPREDLLKIVDAGRLAASGHNLQPWEFIVITGRDMIERLRARDWMNQAGALVAIVLDSSSRYWLEDGAAAAQNMLLACTALGYGACWVEGGIIPHEEEYKLALGVPPDRRMIIVLAIGKPAEQPEKVKKNLEQVIRWERY
jgi:nitroreductase